MKTVVLDPLPAELQQLLEQRHRLGLDLYDEMWEGTYHMTPAPHPHHGYVDREVVRILGPLADEVGLVGTGPFNLGRSEDYRVPDQGYHRSLPNTTFVPTAEMVVEVVSPGDETFDKLPFFASRGVAEVLLVDPTQRTVQFLALAGDGYVSAERSACLGIAAGDLRDRIRWPETRV